MIETFKALVINEQMWRGDANLWETISDGDVSKTAEGPGPLTSMETSSKQQQIDQKYCCGSLRKQSRIFSNQENTQVLSNT